MNIVDLIKEKPDVVIYTPAKIDCVNNAAMKLNVSFSNEYIDYVMAFGFAIFGGHELTGLCDGKRLDVIQNTFEQRELNPFVPTDLYVVECLDIDGIVIWQNQSGEIFQTMPSGKIELICNSLAEYLSL